MTTAVYTIAVVFLFGFPQRGTLFVETLRFLAGQPAPLGNVANDFCSPLEKLGLSDEEEGEEEEEDEA